jgi:hypothetical protein
MRIWSRTKTYGEACHPDDSRRAVRRVPHGGLSLGVVSGEEESGMSLQFGHESESESLRTKGVNAKGYY